ncbi:MAG: 5-bromo-4-chloroindolyl phosphate hydrolysis family protein [Pseudomonadota bacterium]
MTLPPLARQVVAGLAAAGAFLGLFYGLTLAWWIALLAGVGVFAAAMLLIEPTRPPAQVYVADGVTEADLRAAIARLSEAAGRLKRAAEGAGGKDGALFASMAERVEAIRSHHQQDPRDFRHSRPFINTALGQMVEAVEGYASLAAKARGANRARLGELRGQIEGFLPALEKIEQACLENDFTALEVQVEVLGDQLARRH